MTVAKRKRAEYSDADVRKFLLWSATPSMERMPSTQRGYSEQTGISEDTLTRWKQRPSFERDRQQLIQAALGDDLHDIMYSFRREAMKGSFQHQKMYFEMLGLYVEKREDKQSGEMVIRIEHVDTDPNPEAA